MRNDDVVSGVLWMSKLWDCGVALQQCVDFLEKAKRLNFSVLCLMIGVLSDAYTTSARLQFWVNIEVVFFLLVLLHFKSFTLANRDILASENPTASTLLFNLFSIPIHLTLLMCAKNYLELRELDGTLKKEAEHTIRFDDPDPNTHDVVINVKGQKFHCVKMTLAKHSPHFYDLFFKDPKHTSRKDVLVILHGVNKLNDNVVSGVLWMSKLWDCGVALQQCVDFLEKSSKLSIKEKFDAIGRMEYA
ncbi:hypothetical protein CAEBREN_25991 [Caenorhabditis brenneri]|uniref:BTB domain-containing protein n=1 Tax=Caenorhabditis brenneri TaxID=135651 RepID=G0NJV7_CAEBE|nr:hypothetical protein CAEBREN_25991 [Caenorhabditis brenneri]